MLRCREQTFSAYYCVQLFDSIGFELYAQDVQETNGPMGHGVYCTLDLGTAQSTGKTVLLAEFRPTGADAGLTGVSDLLLSTTSSGDNWRERGYAGVLYGERELCIRVECIRVLYRREWRHAETSWQALKRMVDRMEDPPLALDSETSQTDAAWAKALERLKSYGDNQVAKSRDYLGQIWHKNAENATAGGGCSIS
eukprot:gb/GFBE01043872.1/.p1 GENE.gb/GFBE01043872.1/~~gb/GFBE01043872.1/.p1  ORF type:complete len:196 (+),score=20.45 gb/GFBE01043872.1/:1-588(+)